MIHEITCMIKQVYHPLVGTTRNTKFGNGKKEWVKTEFIVYNIDEEKGKTLRMLVWDDISSLKPDTWVKISFEIECTLYAGSWMTNLVVYHIEEITAFD